MAKAKRKSILVSWHSKYHGVKVLFAALDEFKKKGRAFSRTLYLTASEEERTLAEKEVGEFASARRGIPQIDMVVVPLKDPSRHRDIYDGIKARVLPLLDNGEEVVINVSPGTPAMHAVWLTLHAGGAFPEGTALYSSQWVPEKESTRLDTVDFPITTYLGEVRRGKRENPLEARYDPEECRSGVRRSALESLRLYAALPDAPLLVLGERGTGKTRLVESIVRDIKGKEVVTVACGTLAPELAQSMIFGHVKGAFTGAIGPRTGYLREAQDRILFLDEVQDLPAVVQRQLVRFMQDTQRLFRPLGSDKEESSSAEIVTASNLEPRELHKRLDPDLFDRLSPLSVTVPPLRECREDLHYDWRGVWNELRRSRDIPSVAPWQPEIERALAEDPLAGNMRDLQRLAYLIMAHHEGGERGIIRAINEWKRNQARFREDEPDIKTDIFPGSGTWDDRTGNFCRCLAIWAHETYGTYKAAAEALEKGEKTISTHAGAQSLKTNSP